MADYVIINDTISLAVEIGFAVYERHPHSFIHFGRSVDLTYRLDTGVFTRIGNFSDHEFTCPLHKIWSNFFFFFLENQSLTQNKIDDQRKLN